MADEATIHCFNVNTVEFTPMPQFGGAQAVLYQSPDGKRIAGAFRESGQHTLTMEYDEFLFVIRGTAALTVHGKRHVLGPGDTAYLTQGLTVDFDMSDDFQDVAVLMSDRPIDVLGS